MITIAPVISSLLDGMVTPWAITGGYNLFLRGIKEYTKDVDIITTKGGAFEIQNYFGSYIDEFVIFSEVDYLRSYYCVAYIKKCRIEVMGDPENLIDGRWVVNEGWTDHVSIVDVYGVKLPLIDLSYELYINKLIDNKARLKEIEFAMNLKA